ncbi:MAG: SWIM zinc finger family protein [Planctomycetes bacterium]|nr:SWIM zinc finger family protein [Planctomycetota bacterium]
MTATELERRERRAENEPLVILRREDQNDFLIYSPTAPAKQYVVSSDEQGLTCTCPDFRSHQADPDWQCKHILAVCRQGGSPPSNGELRIATSSQSGGGGPSQLLIRRSVSPDGKIDSLSIEWSCPIDEWTHPEVAAHALQVLTIADGIIEQYLGPKPAAPVSSRVSTPIPIRTQPPTNGHGLLPAQLVSIGGMDGRFGRRLFLQFESPAGSMRLFGSAKQLAEALQRAGYAHLAGNIVEGLPLNVPCQVMTKPSADGRYQNVDQVLPPSTGNAPRRWVA